MVRTRRASILLLVLSFFGLGLSLSVPGLARAESAAASQLKTLKEYGVSHKSCQGWTDGCALCARRADGSLGCSRMGVGCTIETIQCTQPERDPKTGKTPPSE